MASSQHGGLRVSKWHSRNCKASQDQVSGSRIISLLPPFIGQSKWLILQGSAFGPTGRRSDCCVRAGITVENDPWQPGLAAGALQPLPIHPSWKWLRGPTGTWQALLHSECPACAPVHSSPPRVVWGALCLYPKSLLGQSLVVVPLWWSARDGQFQFDAEWDGNFREGSELV